MAGLGSVYWRLVLTTAIWGSVFHLGAYAVRSMAPVGAAVWRFGLAALVLLPYVASGGRWRALRAHLPAVIGMALSGVFVFNVAMFHGLTSTSALNAALIMALSPAIATLLAALLQRRAIAPLQVLGLLSGVAGVACITSGGSWHALTHLQLAHGDALMLLASAAWSVFSVIPARWARDLPPLPMTAASIVLGALLLLALALWQGVATLAVPNVPVALALLYMALIGSVLALAWWNDAVQRLGAARATLFMNLTPLFAALIAAALGEPLHWAHAVGAVLVLAGVSVAVSER